MNDFAIVQNAVQKANEQYVNQFFKENQLLLCCRTVLLASLDKIDVRTKYVIDFNETNESKK